MRGLSQTLPSNFLRGVRGGPGAPGPPRLCPEWGMPLQPFSVRAIDWAMSLLVVPAALVMRRYRSLGTETLVATTRRLRRLGIFPLRNHYYEPLFDPRQLTAPLDQPRELPGVDLDVPGQLALLEQLTFDAELRASRFGNAGDDPLRFSFGNGMFEAGDAEFLYQFVRARRPGKIVEIGSGHSTRVVRAALEANRAETGAMAEHVCIEPYANPWLEQMEGVRVVRSRVQDCAIDWSRELQAGDLLFIDSSHIIRPQGDVLQEYLEILPRLAAGVFVHVHDIYTPRDYPAALVVDKVVFWNEQYLLEALLTDSHRYEVVAALNHLKVEHFAQLQRVCPFLTPASEPGSFYLRVKEPRMHTRG